MSKDSIVMIYGLYDPRNDELRYIGKANDLDRRLWQHINDAKNGQKTYRSDWIRSLLELNVIPAIKLLEQSTENAWQEDEKAWIAKIKKEGGRLTNLTEGGDGLVGYSHSEETKEKISQTNIESGIVPPNWKGRTQSPEHIRKRVEARQRADNYGHTEESRKNISEGRKGKNLGNTNSLGYRHTEEWKEEASKRTKGENNPMFGKPLSDEAKQRISKKNKGKKRTEEQKKRMSEVAKGRIVSDETKEKLRVANTGKSVSDETKQKLREANLGKKHTPEARQKMGEASRRYWAKKKAKATKR